MKNENLICAVNPDDMFVFNGKKVSYDDLIEYLVDACAESSEAYDEALNNVENQTRIHKSLLAYNVCAAIMEATREEREQRINEVIHRSSERIKRNRAKLEDSQK